MFTKRFLFSVLVIVLFLALNVPAEKVATVGYGSLCRMEYAMWYDEYGYSVAGATCDWYLQSVTPGYAGVAYLNVVTDLNIYSYPSDGPEWPIQNVPVLIWEDSTASTHSVWFDPLVFDTPDWPGEYSPWPGNWYETWICLSDTEILTQPTHNELSSWDYFVTPCTYAIWGALDTYYGLGQVDEETLFVTAPATTSGETASASTTRITMPDIAQKTNECGPTSAANSLRWLAKEHGFNDKLPKKNDDLIKDLMKAMTDSNDRPFGGLRGDQLRDGKIKYAEEKGLPMTVKGGMNDPNASGSKAFDFIKSEFDAGEDIEFLIKWPGENTGSHWVTVAGYAIKGDRLFLSVNDPDDSKTGTVTWELKRNGDFKTPKGKMLWAVSESYVKPDDTAAPGTETSGHTE